MNSINAHFPATVTVALNITGQPEQHKESSSLMSQSRSLAPLLTKNSASLSHNISYCVSYVNLNSVTVNSESKD